MTDDSARLGDIDGVGQLLIISKHVVTYSMTTENLCYFCIRNEFQWSQNRALRYTAVHHSSLWSNNVYNERLRSPWQVWLVSAEPSTANRSRRTAVIRMFRVLAWLVYDTKFEEGLGYVKKCIRVYRVSVTFMLTGYTCITNTTIRTDEWRLNDDFDINQRRRRLTRNIVCACVCTCVYEYMYI